MSTAEDVDLLVIGSGPGGQKAAICAAKAGKKVALVEREGQSGGACVHHGTIPSKTLRETALALRSLERRTGGVLRPEIHEDLEIASLMTRLADVVRGHQQYIGDQLRRNDVALVRGQGRLVSTDEVEVVAPGGSRRRLRAKHIVLATGSRPRRPDGIEIDHEHVFDSDSVLSMTYLPRSLIVLGAGVVASEYASIFASLGVVVTMIDGGERPMSFLDPDLTRAFVDAFTATGARFLDRRQAVSAQYDGAGSCKVTLRDGEVLSAEKVLCAQGRQPSIDGLGLAEIGVETTSRGFVRVDAHCRTNVPTIYAVGDLVGPPALASTAMEQGRRAARHALGQSGDASRDGAARAALDAIPFCAYTIPEIASVGLGAAEARAAHGDVIIGRAPYAELARAHVSACGDGLIKLVACPAGQKLLGVQIVGEGASELVHVGQMGILGGVEIDSFIEATFNYPTLAEGYRVAALDIVRQRRR